MLTRRTHATLLMALAVALLASTVACGSARSTRQTQTSGMAMSGTQGATSCTVAAPCTCTAAAPCALDTTNCATCHDFPPSTNLHQVHFAADSGATGGIPHSQIDCLNCHPNITSVSQPGHINDAQGKPLPSVPVPLNDPASLAGITQPGATRAGAPSYDSATKTCSNIYCHGAGLKGATPDIVATPAWNAPHGTVGCGNCHGIPPADHAAGITQLACHRCHGDAIDASGQVNPATHVNGKVDLASDVATSCSACHGDQSVTAAPGDPASAPPTDAEGRSASDPSATSIGAHQNHLVAGVLGVKVACSECHVVPATLDAPGHLDNQVMVTFGPLASKGGLSPSYDFATQTCSNVYCHGNFPFSKVTLPPPAPTWNGGANAVTCGTCHGLPPPPPAHVVIDVATQGCGTSTNPAITCHPAPYSPTTVDPRLHIDGKVCPPFCTP